MPPARTRGDEAATTRPCSSSSSSRRRRGSDRSSRGGGTCSRCVSVIVRNTARSESASFAAQSGNVCVVAALVCGVSRFAFCFCAALRRWQQSVVLWSPPRSSESLSIKFDTWKHDVSCMSLEKCPTCSRKSLSSPTLTYPWAGCSSWNAQRDRRKWFGRVQGIGAGDDSSGLVSISEVVRFFSTPFFVTMCPGRCDVCGGLQRAGSVCLCVCVRSIDLNQDSRQRDSFNGLVYVHPAIADS